MFLQILSIFLNKVEIRLEVFPGVAMVNPELLSNIQRNKVEKEGLGRAKLNSNF